MSDTTLNAIWLASYILTFAVSGVTAFLSFIWLVAGAVAGVGLMPWLVIFPISLTLAAWAAWRLEL